jgi:hypothetical protein
MTKNCLHTPTSSYGYDDGMGKMVFHIEPFARGAPFHPEVDHPLHPVRLLHRACHKIWQQ